MTTRPPRPVPDLSQSTLVHHGGSTFVDRATGMVLTRVGFVASNGYETVAVSGGGQRSAHRIVMEAVTGEAIPPDLVVNHIDGCKTNNAPTNLEIVRQARNVEHAYEIGLRSRTATGCHSHGRPPVASTLSPEDVQRIKEAKRGTITALAADLGIARSYAYQIRSGRRLSDAPQPAPVVPAG